MDVNSECYFQGTPSRRRRQPSRCHPTRRLLSPSAPTLMSTVSHNIRVLTSPKEIVHLEYNAQNLPPPPSDEWTRFVCISDTHSRTFDVPDGDVLLHSGDLTNTGTVEDFKKTMGWLYSLPHKIKMLVLFIESFICI